MSESKDVSGIFLETGRRVEENPAWSVKIHSLSRGEREAGSKTTFPMVRKDLRGQRDDQPVEMPGEEYL